MKKFRAFTLIELLVVVAIIALLIALLLPMLAKAKEQSKMVKCGTNLKMIGTAVATYASQNQDIVVEGQCFHIPGIMAGSALANCSWAESLVLDGDVLEKTRTAAGSATMTGHNPAQGTGIFLCPNADPGLQYGYGPGGEYSGYGLAYWATSHFMNINGAMPNTLTNDTGQPRIVKMAMLKSGKIFGADGFNVMAGQSSVGSWGYWVYQRHFTKDTKGSGQARYKGFANYLFCDMHVEFDDSRYYKDTPGTIVGHPERSAWWYQQP